MIVLSLVTGCAAPARPGGKLNDDEGLLVFQVINNSDQKNVYRNTTITSHVEMWSFDKNELFTLHMVRVGMSSTDVYLGHMPPGKYRLDQFVTTDEFVVPGYSRSMNKTVLPIGKNFSHAFEIKPKHLTNLGTVVVWPRDNKHQSVSFTVGHIPSETLLNELVTKIRPAAAQVVFTNPVLGWSNSLPLTHGIIAMAAKATPAHFNHPIVTRAGELVGGAKLGQVLVRSPNGNWNRLDTGFPWEILSVVETPSGELLVGGEQGLLLVSQGKRSVWRRITDLHLKGPITSLGFRENTYYAVAFSPWLRHSLGFAYSKGLRLDNWQASTVSDLSVHEAGLLTRTTLFTSKKIRLAVPPLLVLDYDSKSQAWTKNQAMENSRLLGSNVRIFSPSRDPWLSINLHEREDGVLYGPGFSDLAWVDKEGRPEYLPQQIILSKDSGATWESRNTLPRKQRMLDVWFRDTKVAYAITTSSGHSDSGFHLSSSTDEGNTWAEIGSLPIRADRILGLNGDRVLVILNRHGEVYTSMNRGVTWAREWPIPESQEHPSKSPQTATNTKSPTHENFVL
jgi:hypothetical protein